MDATKPTGEQAARPLPPPPLEANDQVVIWVGTAAWAVALVVLLIIRDSLPAGQRWWIWTCVCGVAFGLFALLVRAEAEARPGPGRGGQGRT